MATRQLGALDSVDPREAWDHEAQDFTPWLAENLDRLATEIGFNLELEGTEVHVGSRRADIVARNPEDDSRVLIENQLEHADLHHLGQVLVVCLRNGFTDCGWPTRLRNRRFSGPDLKAAVSDPRNEP